MRIAELQAPHSIGEKFAIGGFKTAAGAELRGKLLSLSPNAVTFEMFGADAPLQLSEVLKNFKIVAGKDEVVYDGEVLINSAADTGSTTIYVAALAGPLMELDLRHAGNLPATITVAYQGFMQRWQQSYRILPEFKSAVADIESYLTELRLWLDQLDLSLARMPQAARQSVERDILQVLPFRAALDGLLERFEMAAASVPLELAETHRLHCRRQLHPLFMCSPFMHRIYTKPLGYAGDYEMIDMIIRNQLEGKTLFAKLLHKFILDTPPAHSVRNRAAYFTRRFTEEGTRVSLAGRAPKFFSLGCGPAREVQDFLTAHALSDRAQFTLLDFNPETLAHTSKRLAEIRRACHRHATINTIQKSVYLLLKEAGKGVRNDEKHDIIYCSGLYDYLNDRVCRQLNTYLYDFLNPGGVLIVTNFDPVNPIRNIMEYIYEWFLIHRDAQGMAAMAPEQAARDDWRVLAEPTGCNVFLEARKPA
jgi:extracellular factor (EF) 3-hydroxypalmitic acid methyl ester biosynthesis protein